MSATSVAVFPPEALLCFLDRNAVLHEILQAPSDLLFVYVEVGGEFLDMIV